MEYSILMSVYAGEKPQYLRECMESMTNQTKKAEQFVIVRNGPLTEELDRILEEYVAKDPELYTFVEHETNQPLGVSLDSGIAVCRNELVARMDSDNIATPDRCEKLVALFEEDEGLSIAGGYSVGFYNDDLKDARTVRKVPCTDEEIKHFVRRRSPFNHSTIMFRKSEVIRCGGYGTSRRKEDFDLFSRMMNMGCTGKNIPEIIMNARANEASFKRKKSWMYVSDYMQVMKRNHKAGYCSLIDRIVVDTYQILLFILPVGLGKWFSMNVLRKKAK